ncbi:MAG: Do family serine endopeptidase [Gammaproteobacteria bacterium]|nr:Do family serine endopeptidase [Gammaproteobacteria bacterium]MDH5729067.1 Do family serine endopeptidase [Gammaproteobacteria bacterium]
MADSDEQRNTIRTLIKFTLIGMTIAFVVLYIADDDVKIDFSSSTVEFKEISAEDDKQLHDKAMQGPVSYSNAVAKAAPSVVNIFTAKTITQERAQVFEDPLFEYFFGDRAPMAPQKRTETSLGSGVIISEQGFILTNNHVIESAEEIQVALKDGRSAQAKVVGTDPESDLAVLQITLNNLPSITMGHSGNLNVGDVVLAIGNPFGVGQTVTMGIVSATGRDRIGLNTFEDFIQTDAAINPGNSGGALINAHGYLVGINTAIFSRSGGSQGIGFAIPVSAAKDVTQQIIEKGHVVRGWLGIEIQDMTPQLAESFSLDEVSGVIVAGVLKNGPADQAQLRPGDIIIKIEGEKVSDGKFAVNRIARAAPGTQINLSILRNRKNMEIKATTAERPVPQDN